MTTFLKTKEAYKSGNKKAAYLMYLNDSTVHTILDYSSFCEYFDGLCK